jgi:hypothetical protein
VLNPYDPCVASKVINDRQMTVCWHVDNLKVSHVDPDEVTKFGSWLSNNHNMMVVKHRGKVHDYLGMILDYSTEGKVMVNMLRTSRTSLRSSGKRSWQPAPPRQQITYSGYETQPRGTGKGLPPRYCTIIVLKCEGSL